MKISSYIRRPETVVAIQWTGSNYLDVCSLLELDGRGRPNLERQCLHLPGAFFAHVGDWVMVSGSGISKCSAQEFERLYQSTPIRSNILTERKTATNAL